MGYNTPYYNTARQRRQAWRASANDPSMPEHWGEFVNGGGESFLQDIDASAAISGGLALGANYSNMVNQGLNLQDGPAMQRSATGEPVYTGGSVYNDAFLSKPQGATGGEILSGAGQGAAAGTAVMPGIGTAVGAAVGAGVSIFGGARRKKKQRDERDKALKKVQSGQRNFNNASEAFSEQQTALSDYRQRLNIGDQLYNLYR